MQGLIHIAYTPPCTLQAKYATLASLLPQIPSSLLYRVEPTIVAQLLRALEVHQVRWSPRLRLGLGLGFGLGSVSGLGGFGLQHGCPYPTL